jgi:hypothetical protein
MDLFLGNRGRPVLGAADEAGDLVGVLDQMPGLVVHDHFNQHITREELALGGLFLAVLDLDHFFGRNQDATKLALHAGAVDALAMLRSTAFSMPE